MERVYIHSTRLRAREDPQIRRNGIPNAWRASASHNQIASGNDGCGANPFIGKWHRDRSPPPPPRARICIRSRRNEEYTREDSLSLSLPFRDCNLFQSRSPPVRAREGAAKPFVARWYGCAGCMGGRVENWNINNRFVRRPLVRLINIQSVDEGGRGNRGRERGTGRAYFSISRKLNQP